MELCDTCGINTPADNRLTCDECLEIEYAAEMCWQAKVAKAEREYQDAVLGENADDPYTDWQHWYDEADADIVNAY